MPYRRDPRFLDLFDVSNIGARLNAGLNFSVQLSFLVLFVLVAVGAWLSYRHTQLLFGDLALVAHTHEVSAQVRMVQATLIDAETGVRGFVITGSEESLEPYRSSVVELGGRLETLEQLTADNPQQSALIQVLRQRAQARIEHLDWIVKLGHAADVRSTTELVRADEGAQLMNSVRSVIAQIEDGQNALLAARSLEARRSYETAQITGLAIAATGAILVLVLYQLVRRFDLLRVRVARDAEDAHQRFRVMLGSIGDAVLVTDARGRLTFCNQAAGQMLGLGTEALGRPLEHLLGFVSESSGAPSPNVMALARAARGVARTPVDTAVRFPDGRLLPVGATAALILDRTGAEDGIVVVVRDVSERRERERELARSIERFRALVHAASQVVWTTDADGGVQEDSPSWRRITGQTYEQWKGRGWLEALHPEDRERVRGGWEAAIAAREPHQDEFRLRHADGSYHWTISRTVPVLDPDGQVREWVGMNADIQARKEAEEAEREAHQRKDEFIALLAHELRNPLAPIRNALEVLKHGEPADGAHAIAMMDRQVGHMVRLIDDLLDVSRISHGKLELRLERLDLRDVVRQSIEAGRAGLEERQQRLRVDLGSRPLWVEGDRVRLAQVVTNLLNNAIKYSGREASIWISGEREGRQVLVIVRDTGQGIPSELKPRIFDLFMQGGGRVEKSGGGLGIGLTLVRRIVEMHHGTVVVLSEGPGTGSEFQVRLPAADPPREFDSRDHPSRSSAARALRVLVIDDNEDSADSLSMLIQLGGHSVRTAYRAETGLEELRAFEPEVILCDILMPGMSGFEFARSLRAGVHGSPALLVALTGFGADADRAASTAAGFHRHLVKPIDPDVLAALLHEAAQRDGAGGSSV